jgi:hypothetical protein
MRDGFLALGVAASIFFLAYANGGFFPTTRAYAAIAVWWLLGLGAALGIGSALSRVGRLATAAPVLLGLFAVWTLISVNWAPDAGLAFAQFDEVSLYVAVLVIGILLARVVRASFLVGAVALALTAIAVVALISRFFPSSFGAQAGETILTTLAVRLSFPLGYWNGLGIDVALAYPLLLATMAARRSRIASGLAAMPLPVLAAVMYLTSSRGAFVAAGVAVVAYLILAPRRWSALAAAVLAGAAGAFSVAILVPRTALVSGQMSTALGVQQGHQAALAIGIACLVTGAVWLGIAELGRRIPAPPSVVGWAVAAVAVLAAIAAIVAAHPIAKFQAFKSAGQYGGSQTFDTQHLLQSSGSGRWQFWGAAIGEFRAHPLNGGGAGSWEAWWLRHESYPLFTLYPHSLYLEALAELGIVGLLLIGAAVVVGVVGAVRSAFALRSGEVAAAAACGIAFFAAAAYDWVWQLAAVAVVGVAMLGVAIGAMPSTRSRAWGRFELGRPLLAVVAVAAIIPQVVILAAGIHLRNSQNASLNGNGTRARTEALAAKAIEPWSATPYLELAEIEIAERHFGTARHWIEAALSRSDDYQLWIVAAEIDTARGNILLAHHDLEVARSLYPRSRYFQSSS